MHKEGWVPVEKYVKKSKAPCGALLNTRYITDLIDYRLMLILPV